MDGGTSGGLKKKGTRVKHRIACSVLIAIGSIALVQPAAAGAETPQLAPDGGPFGQTVGGTLVVDVVVALAVSGCPDGKVCFWKQADYNGDRKTADSGDAGVDLTLGAYDRSMKNRLAGRRVVIKDIDYDPVDCINAGGERNNLSARAALFKVGAAGSTC
jgi:hypothetical protein